MEWIPQNRKEWMWLIIIAVGLFVLSLFYLLRPGSPSWSWFACYPIFGFVVGLLNKMSLPRSLHITIEGVFVGIIYFMFFPYVLSVLFLLSLPILYFIFGTVIGRMIKEKYVHHSTVELSERWWIFIIVMFCLLFDFILLTLPFYEEMYQARSPLLLLFFIAFFAAGFFFGHLLRFEEKRTFRVILKGVLIAHCPFFVFFALSVEWTFYPSLLTGLILFVSVIGSYVGVKLRERLSIKE